MVAKPSFRPVPDAAPAARSLASAASVLVTLPATHSRAT